MPRSSGQLLDPRVYVGFARESVRRWPSMRAVARNWPIWITRQLLRPAVSVRCWIRTRAGTRIFLCEDPIDDVILRHVMKDEAASYFPPEPVPAGALILDVGAHHGIYAVEALRRSPRARLIAVEPDPRARSYFERNVHANGMDDRVEYHEAALGAVPGRAELVLAPESWAHSVAPTPDAAQRPVVSVRAATVGQVLGERVPHLVKLNAEGAEFAVVPDLIARGILPQWIVLMIHPHGGIL